MTQREDYTFYNAFDSKEAFIETFRAFLEMKYGKSI